MRTTTRAGIAAVLLLVCSVLSAQSTEIVFVNRTGETVYFLYASASTADSWGEDLLGATVLADGATFRARLNSRAETFDVRAIDANDNEYIIWGFRPGADRRITLTTRASVGGQATSEAASNAAVSWVTVVNDTNYDVRAIYIVPATTSNWDDAEQLLPPGETLHFREDFRLEIDVERYGTTVYDVMLVDVDGDSYVKRDVNLELATELVYSLDDLEWR
jgi:hypothetical protein